jgi:hypothetical protein
MANHGTINKKNWVALSSTIIKFDLHHTGEELKKTQWYMPHVLCKLIIRHMASLPEATFVSGCCFSVFHCLFPSAPRLEFHTLVPAFIFVCGLVHDAA